ncbi:Ubiquitin [Giardia muris]|uniref:Ubiquitin n=1 Tax=Giardia muris TaxID=5742 RepID=A0A4Z1T973_GIAMU|nr:Ubiquitin [Giardia muris]|eukprot:TNJ29697.1 Ubiquitin [Giardia muris]
MLIRVQLSTGYLMTLDVAPSETVLDLKNRIFDQEGIFPAQQKILYMAQQLQNHITIEEASLKAGVTLQLVVNLRGG